MNGDVTVHLPHSLTDAAERIAREGGTTLAAFVASAVAEKLSAIQSAALLAERGRRADLEAFDRFMSRPNGFPPALDDRLND
ncbi:MULTISPECIES: toxin-antitoxin system HicB family antitoxin [unclassified Methylobacterium]|uniref:toxin-antitoxin system HicB family antitoxin n=1 Tax=unclassified Methylobacterium TaxID=2615210 RepID=UPI001FB9B78C|nr:MULTISPECIES: toxin-antitoxin system HicB family antitoxin [unclassified Methylobacterium]MCJ2021949.1 toxin-antitoxin system HicB family antitoxin [Methylobacterium sp. E-065]